MRYQRVMVKVSGEALGGVAGRGFDDAAIRYFANELQTVITDGVQIALVIGAGNLVRGEVLKAQLGESGVTSHTADQIGMLATVQNALVVRDVLTALNLGVSLFATHGIPGVASTYSIHAALQALDRGEVVICAGGTGNPYFTTDSAACLRGIELGVDAVLKATKVDGVYDGDPQQEANASKFDVLTFREMIEKQLKVIDLTASALCEQHGLPLVVYQFTSAGALARIVGGSREGSLVRAK